MPPNPAVLNRVFAGRGFAVGAGCLPFSDMERQRNGMVYGFGLLAVDPWKRVEGKCFGVTQCSQEASVHVISQGRNETEPPFPWDGTGTKRIGQRDETGRNHEA